MEVTRRQWRRGSSLVERRRAETTISLATWAGDDYRSGQWRGDHYQSGHVETTNSLAMWRPLSVWPRGEQNQSGQVEGTTISMALSRR